MKYILNHTDTILSLGKYNEIAPGKYGTITDAEVEAPEIIYAVRAKWATVHAEIPKELDFSKPEIQFVGQAYQDEAPAAPEPEVIEEVAPVVEEAVVEVAEEAVVEEAKPAARGRKTK